MATEDSIIQLLAAKHAKDVFVPQCKAGSTWGLTSPRLDAWAFRRSWANPLATGYEIKCARPDFVRDDKWPAYLEFCNAFYFVCPAGVIEKSEVPQDAGLLVVSKTGSRLFTKKKAPYRDIEVNPLIYQYVLMSRTRVVAPYAVDNGRSPEHWRWWLTQKAENQKLGSEVGHRMGQVLGRQVHEVECENIRLKRENEKLADVREILERLGLDAEDSRWTLERQAEELARAVPKGLTADIANAIRQLRGFQEQLNELEPLAVGGNS